MKYSKTYYLRQNKIKYLFLAATVFFIAAALTGIFVGSVKLDISNLFGGISGQILLHVRLPRTLACLTAGAALAVAGCIIQSVLGNRLASPGIMGINSGAGLAVTLGAALGIYGSTETALFSFVGAFASVTVIALGAKKWGGSKSTVILMGVALNSLLNAISSTVITLDPDAGVISNNFRVGDFSAVTLTRFFPAAVMICAACILAFLMANSLDVLSLGDETAASLGMNTRRTRMFFLLLAAALAGSAVCLAGLLSFVGLIVPNALRFLLGSRSRRLLPLSALLGGGFVCVCDTVARSAFAPYEIPVGIIMAFVGAPFFVFLIVKGGGIRDKA